jgi:hypothetical protein
MKTGDLRLLYVRSRGGWLPRSLRTYGHLIRVQVRQNLLSRMVQVRLLGLRLF